MAYLTSASDSKRLKHIDQQGREELEAHDRVAFLDAATAAAAVVLQAGCSGRLLRPFDGAFAYL